MKTIDEWCNALPSYVGSLDALAEQRKVIEAVRDEAFAVALRLVGEHRAEYQAYIVRGVSRADAMEDRAAACGRIEEELQVLAGGKR